jgi:hypothetical protein
MAGRASTVLMMPNMGAYAQSPSYKHVFNIYAASHRVLAIKAKKKAL